MNIRAQRLINFLFPLAVASPFIYGAMAIGMGLGAHEQTKAWEAFSTAHHCVMTQAPVDFDQPTTWTCDALPDHPDALARIGIRVQR